MNYLLTGDVWALHEEFLCEIYRCHTHQNTEGISLFCALCTYCTTMQAEIRGNFQRFWACELMCRNNFTLCGCILFFLKLWKIPAGEIQVCECVEKIGCGRIKCKKITSMVMLHKGLLLRTFEYRFKVENWSYTCIHKLLNTQAESTDFGPDFHCESKAKNGFQHRKSHFIHTFSYFFLQLQMFCTHPQTWIFSL